MDWLWSAAPAALLTAAIVSGLFIWWRCWTLLRTPGTFRARVRRPGAAERGRSVIGRYNEAGLELLRPFSLNPRPLWRTRRHRACLDRLDPTAREGTVLARLAGDDTAPVELELSHEECSGLRAWIESGPAAGFGAWRDEAWSRRRSRH